MNISRATTSPFQLGAASHGARPHGKEPSLLDEARAFLQELHLDPVAGKQAPDFENRLNQIKLEIDSKGFYTHTFKELQFGCRLAWKNSNRCIGRHFWRTLQVVDQRDCATQDAALNALNSHVDRAFNGGQIQNVITVFPPRCPGRKDAWRMLNHQLVRYAGFKQPDGTVVGDPDSVPLTEHCLGEGWKPPSCTPWTPLPWVLVENGVPCGVHDPWTKGTFRDVPIVHPEFPDTLDVGLRWYPVPILADMALKIGGIVYPFAPFNGHYLGTEIAARNLVDPDRYNVLTTWGKACGLNTEAKRSLWQDEALVRLNQALIASFDEAGITMGDHHELGRAFEQWCQAENRQGREVLGDWTWLNPPMSASLTPQFHRHFTNEVVTHTNFFYQPPVERNGQPLVPKSPGAMRNQLSDATPAPLEGKGCPFLSMKNRIKDLWS
jgi:nitric-oxide synthase